MQRILLTLALLATAHSAALAQFALRQSTASQEIPIGYQLDNVDGDSEETGLSLANTDIKVWKNGGTTLNNKNSGGATHISNGIYYAVLDATDTDTLGPMVIFVHKSGALAERINCHVLPANVFDSLYSTDKLQIDVAQYGDVNGVFSGGRPEVNSVYWGGTIYSSANVRSNVIQWSSSNVPAPATAGYPVITVKVGNGTGEINASGGVVPSNLTQVNGSTTIDGKTPQEVFALLQAALAGDITGGPTAPVAKSPTGETRITGAVDGSGNRTTTLNVTNPN